MKCSLGVNVVSRPSISCPCVVLGASNDGCDLLGLVPAEHLVEERDPILARANALRSQVTHLVAPRLLTSIDGRKC